MVVWLIVQHLQLDSLLQLGQLVIAQFLVLAQTSGEEWLQWLQ